MNVFLLVLLEVGIGLATQARKMILSQNPKKEGQGPHTDPVFVRKIIQFWNWQLLQ
jgi:hypothetical protein